MRVFLCFLLFKKMHCHLLPWGLDMWRACTVYKPPSGERGHQCDRSNSEGITSLWCWLDIKPYLRHLTVWVWTSPIFFIPQMIEGLWFPLHVLRGSREGHQWLLPCWQLQPSHQCLECSWTSGQMGSSGGWEAPVAKRTPVTCWWEWQESGVSCCVLFSRPGRDLHSFHLGPSVFTIWLNLGHFKDIFLSLSC